MSKLINRQRPIPFGLTFYQPEIRWRPRSGSSFTQIVEGLIVARRANPVQTSKHKWATDYESVANEVDAYNAAICETMGWKEYISADGRQSVTLPFSQGARPMQPSQPRAKSLASKLRSVAAGAETIVETVTKKEAVSPELSSQRASVCVRCPLNEKGDLLRFFTVPASEAIRKAFGMFNSQDLKTPYDDQLGTCSACNCPMKLKVHFPKDRIMKNIPQADYDALHADCWLRKE